MQRLELQKEAEQRENLKKHVDEQKNQLLEFIPEWKDSKLADKEKKLVVKFGVISIITKPTFEGLVSLTEIPPLAL